MRIWLITASLMAATAAGTSALSAQSASVEASATIIAAVTPPPSLERLLPGGRFDAAPAVIQPQGSQLIHTVVTGSNTAFANAPSAISSSAALEVVKKGAGSVFERSKPLPAAKPDGTRPVVVTWTIAANA